MRYVLALLAMTAAFGLAGPAVADDGAIPDAVLAQMGLAQMKPMTDAQGSAVRGKGFSLVWGSSFAQLGASWATNGYVSLDTGLATSAQGSGLSFVFSPDLSGFALSGGMASANTHR